MDVTIQTPNCIFGVFIIDVEALVRNGTFQKISLDLAQARIPPSICLLGNGEAIWVWSVPANIWEFSIAVGFLSKCPVQTRQKESIIPQRESNVPVVGKLLKHCSIPPV